MKRWILVLSATSLAASLLAGCGVVSGAASVAGAAVSVTSTVVETAADVVTYPIR